MGVNEGEFLRKKICIYISPLKTTSVVLEAECFKKEASQGMV